MTTAVVCADAIRADVKRTKMEITSEELESLITESRRRAARTKAGTWNLEEEEEQRVQERKEKIKSEGDAIGGMGGDQISRMGSMQIRKASLRGVNRSKMKVRGSAQRRSR